MKIRNNAAIFEEEGKIKINHTLTVSFEEMQILIEMCKEGNYLCIEDLINNKLFEAEDKYVCDHYNSEGRRIK